MIFTELSEVIPKPRINVCVCFQMAGNPDQQEDTLDDQYQEDGEDEVCLVISILYILKDERFAATEETTCITRRPSPQGELLISFLISEISLLLSFLWSLLF